MDDFEGHLFPEPGRTIQFRTKDPGHAAFTQYRKQLVPPEHHGEIRIGEVFEEDVHPLLSSDYGFDREHFYSAHHAVTGNMFCNDDWSHPPGPSLIGWTKDHDQSRIVYLQPGDGPETYASNDYRRLLENAIRWAAG